MTEGLDARDISAISMALSAPRLGRYIAASYRNRRLALALYRWNAEASGALMVPLSLCEVVLRNAITEAIESVYGRRWFAAGGGFERSLPRPRTGYNPRDDLARARAGHSTAGKVVPELKFMFWVSMLTSRHDDRLWTPSIKTVFSNLTADWTPARSRRLLHDQVESVRVLRNRIAHHEPIFERDVVADYRRFRTIVSWRSSEVAAWMDAIESVTGLAAGRPYTDTPSCRATSGST
jgi:hypothetical protein